MNAHGALTGDEVTIDTRRKSLGNTGGSVAAQGVRRITCGADLSLDIGDLDNTVGMISAVGRVQIDGGAVKNVEGRLATAQGMTLMSHSLDNEGGKCARRRLIIGQYRSIG
ncbi:hypothetical protein SGGMMB4_03201 [Sodalis glossinidius str. 'morsitans']|uniref:Uncharacterized protein n=1 Tax=Sodalis glossinidius (strain morsitans) TaxID=343509 RepID=A0A193QJV5_SODGM|nr:hypothetical protein [Sodalis glossinidius]CRL45462.1 hypothetical protein SGGMMB4_03201 [Sodalis glossinidius str. 'morsitans']